MKCQRFDVSGIPGTNGYCDAEAQKAIEKQMDAEGITPSGVRFLGNGNYHYLSCLVTNRIAEPYTLVLFDHHPDMRAPAFGEILSCGGWVREALFTQSCLKRVLLIGADRALFDEEIHALAEEAAEGDRGDTLLQSACARVVFAADDRKRIRAALSAREASGLPLYLSVDLDVLSTREVRTRWDQGEMTLTALLDHIGAVCEKRRVIGVDICG